MPQGFPNLTRDNLKHCILLFFSLYFQPKIVNLNKEIVIVLFCLDLKLKQNKKKNKDKDNWKI